MQACGAPLRGMRQGGAEQEGPYSKSTGTVHA
jgi:hypothetical protein